MSNLVVELVDTQQRLRNPRIVEVEDRLPIFATVTIRADPPLGYSSGERLLELLGKSVRCWSGNVKYTGRIDEIEWPGTPLTVKLQWSAD